MLMGSTMKTTLINSLAAISLCALFGACAAAPEHPARKAAKTFTLPADAKWQKLDTVAYRGKQDDIFFLNADLGWYVNGGGKIYKTIDGGKTWIEKLSQPGTFFRTVGFVNEKIGFAGNIGIDYFPGVTDTTPLYMTDDGGDTWRAVSSIEGPTVKGLCAIDVLHTKLINSGVLDSRTVIHAGGPAFLLRSMDGGKSWKSQDVSAHTKMILDVKFFDENRGFIMGASDTDTEKSNAIIIATQDGGATWKKVYQSNRPFEITWKASFPTRDTGYVTIQNYNPDKAISQRYVAKTTDGGATWNEIPLVNDHAVRQFGVGFADEKIGWIGTTTGGYQTIDGGTTWMSVTDMGRASNKVRIIRDGNGFVAYAIGLDVRKITVPNSVKP
jgi:photosystem II stability/assembly factor-like uncharacterized protein